MNLAETSGDAAMLYRFGVTVPKNTPESSPHEVNVRLTVGVIERVEITFPAGCAGLVGLRILHREHVVWPTSPDEWFVTDDYTIQIHEHYMLTEGDQHLKIQTYNLDDTYDHTLIVRFEVRVPKEDPQVRILYAMLREIERLRDEQKEGMREASRLLRALERDLKELRQYDLSLIRYELRELGGGG